MPSVNHQLKAIRSRDWLLLIAGMVIIACTVIIACLDWRPPLGVTVWLGYAVLTFAAGGTLLMALGSVVIPGDSSPSVVLLNRLLPTSVPWTMARAEGIRGAILATISVPLIGLVLVSALLFWQLDQLLKVEESVAHTDQVMAAGIRALTLLVDMETSLREYELTGDRLFLRSFQQADQAIDGAFIRVRVLVADNGPQVKRMDELGALITQWRIYATSRIKARQSWIRFQDTARTIEGTQRFNVIRQQTADILESERQLREIRSRAVEQQARLFQGGMLIAFLALGAIVWLVVRRRVNAISSTYLDAMLENKTQAALLSESEDRLHLAVREQRVAEDATREIEERLRTFVGQLEELVGQRTAELVQSQEQLRALATELNLTEQRERSQLANDLHDHLAQMLVLGKMRLSQIRQSPHLPPHALALLKETDDVLTQSLTYTKTLVADLAPTVLDHFGLPAGLKWLGEQMRDRYALSVTMHIADEDVKLPKDQTVLLFQSVRELLINVWKHGKTAEASVSLTQHNDELRIEVQDGGAGFDAAAFPTPLSSKFGLFSIRERMRALGGTCVLESAPGKGTMARLTLPYARTQGGSEVQEAERKRHAGQKRRSQPSPHTSGRIRVLLVDDHAMVRQGLRSVLESYADIEVIGEAWDGEEAVAAVEMLRPSVVVMDVNMPRMNGIDATSQIKSRYADTIVIGLSVNANGEAQEAMLQAGATKLLTKEAAVDELYSAIQLAWSQRQQRTRGGVVAHGKESSG